MGRMSATAPRPRNPPLVAGGKLGHLGAALGNRVMDQRKMSEGQRAYEAKRAAKAGVSLDKWLAMREREKREEVASAEKAAKAATAAAAPPKPPGFFKRLMERAQKPL